MSSVPLAEAIPGYTPIPEITIDQVDPTIDSIVERRLAGEASYGAYVIQAGGLAVMDRAIAYYAQKLGVKVIGEALGKLNFTVNAANDPEQGLHKDVGRANDMTAHCTTDGIVRVAILPDYESSKNIAYYGATINEIFATKILDREPVGRILAADLSAGDNLIFDSTLYHIFMSLTPDRHSTARWLNPGRARI